MARHAKDTVGYFPHYCDHGKTLFIIEQHYGNDGYAFWFKLLELLSKTEGHYYDCSSIDNWEFLQAKTRFLGVKCQEILDKLALLGAIDRELWENDRIIWSENLVNNISDAYKNRKRSVPQKPISTSKNPISTPSNPQIKTNQNKTNQTITNHSRAREDGLMEDPVDKSAEEETIPTGDRPVDSDSDFKAFWRVYPRREGMSRAMEAWERTVANGAKPRELLLAAQKYAVVVLADKTEKKFMKMPHTFLADDIFQEYLPAPPANEPDCGQCPDREQCHDGLVDFEVYDDFLKRSYIQAKPCPLRDKAVVGYG